MVKIMFKIVHVGVSFIFQTFGKSVLSSKSKKSRSRGRTVRYFFEPSRFGDQFNNLSAW